MGRGQSLPLLPPNPPTPPPPHRHLQQHAEPCDALERQQQEGWQRQPFTLREALKASQLGGEAHVRVPAEAVHLEALEPQPCSPASSPTRATAPPPLPHTHIRRL